MLLMMTSASECTDVAAAPTSPSRLDGVAKIRLSGGHHFLAQPACISEFSPNYFINAKSVANVLSELIDKQLREAH